MTSLSIDDFGPLPVVRPATVADLGDAVRAAVAVYPVGGQTHLGVGRVPSREGTVIDVRGLDQIVDFPARDMTVTVQAGISLKKLQDTITPENLRLPIDIPRADSATLGGALAVNVSGPRRFGYGTLRDYVIGISAVNDEGREFKAGGRVVKNVAGYDLCKLLVGSLGTLGIITQATLKLRPLAEERALVCLPCAAARIGPLLDSLAASRTRPVVLDVVNRAAAGEALGHVGAACASADWAILVGYEGNADAVKWQMQHLVKELGASVPMEARVGFTAEALDRAMTEWPAWPGAALSLKASMLPSAVPGFLAAVESFGSSPLVRAHAGNGIVQAHYGDIGLEAARSLAASWRKAAITVVTRCPAAWKRDIDVWGSPPRDIELMRRVKAAFDPRGVFNPGRSLV